MFQIKKMFKVKSKDFQLQKLKKDKMTCMKKIEEA